MVSIHYYSKDLAAYISSTEQNQGTDTPETSSTSAKVIDCMSRFLRAAADAFAKGACCRSYHRDLVEDIIDE